MAVHPIEDVVESGQLVQKAEFKDYVKKRTPIVCTSTEILTLDLTDVAAVIADGRLYGYQASDTTTPHNGSTVCVDLTGRRYYLTARRVIFATRNYFVRPDGNDTNTGLGNTAGTAFLTIQKAIDIIFGTLDLNGQAVTISVADGTYGRCLVDSPQVGKGTVTLQGNAVTPTNVILTSTPGPNPTDGTIQVMNGATLYVKDLSPRSVTTGSALCGRAGGRIYFENLNFAATAASNPCIIATSGGYVEATGNYTVSGSAGMHMWANALGEVRVQSKTITFTGTPAWGNANVRADYGGIATVNGNTWSGAATGRRFTAENNGVIAAFGGANEIPGNTPGQTSNGGVHPALGAEVLAFIIACSDNTSAIGVGANKAKFRMPFAFNVNEVRGSLFTAQTSGGLFTVDVNKNGTSIISTKLTFDNTEQSTVTAATPAVITVPVFSDNDEVEIDVDSIGDGTARGLIVTLIGYRI